MTTPNTVSPAPQKRAKGEILPDGTRSFIYQSPRGPVVEIHVRADATQGAAVTPENDRLALEAEEAAMAHIAVQALVVRELSYVAYGHETSGEPRKTATAEAHAEYVGAIKDCLSGNAARVGLLLAMQTLDTDEERQTVKDVYDLGLDPRVILAMIIERNKAKRGG